LAGNVDLLAKAAELLAQKTPRRLDVDVTPHDGGTAFTVTTANLTSVDIYVNGRPAGTTPVVDGENSITIPIAEPKQVTARLEGFDGDTLAAARTVTLGP
jgi:hypothetical protein